MQKNGSINQSRQFLSQINKFKTYVNRGQAYNYAFCMKPSEILLPSKQQRRVWARSLLCFWAVKELGLSATSLGQKLGMTQPSVSLAVQRRERFAIDEQLIFELNKKTHKRMSVPNPLLSPIEI